MGTSLPIKAKRTVADKKRINKRDSFTKEVTKEGYFHGEAVVKF